MKIVGLHHVQITIPAGAEPSARAFYCGVLGLTEIPKPVSLQGRGGLWLQLPGRELHLGTQDNINRQQNRAHIAYQVQNLPAWRDHLTQHDLTITNSTPIPGYQRFECRDPFGNRIELIEEIVDGD